MDKSKRIRRDNLIGQHWGLDDDGNSILHVAAATGRLDLLQYFYLDRTHRTDINAQNFMGWTPLMQAARFGHFNCVQFLCEYVDIFKRNKYGLTAISLACAHGDLQSVALLFEYMLNLGGNLNDFENPISPLTFSVLFGHTDLVQFFVSKSFDIYHQSIRTGITAFDCARIIHNKQIMALLQNSRRLSSSNDNNFKSSTLRTNKSGGSVPRISVSNTMKRNASCLSSSISSLDLSPISPVFLVNKTYTLNKSPMDCDKSTKRLSPNLLSDTMYQDILSGSRRTRSNENINLKSPNENSSRSKSNISNGKKQIFFPPDFSNRSSAPNNSLKRISPRDNLQSLTPNLSPGEKSQNQIFYPLPDYENSNQSAASSVHLKRTTPNGSVQHITTPNLSSNEKRKSQIFFPPDFEISNRSTSTLKSPNGSVQHCTTPNDLGSTTGNGKKPIFFPSDFEVSNRNADRLSPMDTMKKNLLPVKCSPTSISPKITCTKTVIAQKQLTTRRSSSNGSVYQQVTKTYVVQQTTKSPINSCCDKMVNTNSNLQFDSKMILNFDSKQYKCPNESFYKMITILQTNGLGKLIPLLITEEIDYEIFLTLSIEDMIDIGITSVDDQQKILNIISQLYY